MTNNVIDRAVRHKDVRQMSNDDLARNVREVLLRLEWLEREQWRRQVFPALATKEN